MFVTSTSGFSLMHATSIKPVGVGLVFSALICAGFCHRKERERNGRGQQSCDIDYEEEKNSKQQNAQSIKRTVPHRNRRRGYFPRTNRTNSATFSCRTRSCTRSQFLQSLIILLLLLSPSPLILLLLRLQEEEEEDLDPFRPYKSKGRAKIAGFI